MGEPRIARVSDAFRTLCRYTLQKYTYTNVNQLAADADVAPQYSDSTEHQNLEIMAGIYSDTLFTSELLCYNLILDPIAEWHNEFGVQIQYC